MPATMSRPSLSIILALGEIPVGRYDSGDVTAGGDTLIDQQYANNEVFLGDSDDSFTTVFLDVFTGNGGGRIRHGDEHDRLLRSSGLLQPDLHHRGRRAAIPFVDAGSTAEYRSTQITSTNG